MATGRQRVTEGEAGPSEVERLLAERRPDLALAAADAAIASDETSELHDLRGRALNNLGRLPDAALSFQRAIELDPESAGAHHHLAHVLLRLGQSEPAEQVLHAALRLDPDLAAAWVLLGSLLTDRGSWPESEVCFRRARELQPERISNHLNHGLALEREGRLAEASEAYSSAAALDPEDPEVLIRTGLLALSMGDASGARETLERAMSLRPDRADAAAGIAAAFDVEGAHQEGLSWLDLQAAELRREPDMVLAAAQLQLHGGDGREALDELRRICDDPSASGVHRSLAWFTRGEILDRHDQTAEAWRAYEQGNMLQPARFDPEAQASYTETLLGRGPFGAHAPEVPLDEPGLPILILGLPRSGSSLLEQMLAMHPDIAAGGERITIGRTAGRARDAVDAGDLESLRALRGALLDDLRTVSADAKRVTDKMWQNFEYLDVIDGLLPDSTVIHIKRDPVDVAMSCYMQSFGYGGVPFSYDPAHITQYIHDHRRLMTHWAEALDLDLIEVEYETLVTDTEAVMRGLLERIGLPWSDACLSPHLSDRVVTTASNAQVREPIHPRRRRRWERYREQLPDTWLDLAEIDANQGG
jgi:Tfp pilus assembly protein PilF